MWCTPFKTGKENLQWLQCVWVATEVLIMAPNLVATRNVYDSSLQKKKSTVHVVCVAIITITCIAKWYRCSYFSTALYRPQPLVLWVCSIVCLHATILDHPAPFLWPASASSTIDFSSHHNVLQCLFLIVPYIVLFSYSFSR